MNFFKTFQFSKKDHTFHISLACPVSFGLWSAGVSRRHPADGFDLIVLPKIELDK
jgi:hypothetical protein